MATLALLNSGHDSSKFKETPRDDPAMAPETDGGYVYTRPRYTRATPTVYTLGFTFITGTDKNALISFWKARRGGSEIFEWDHPISGATLNVRFKKGVIPDETYVGKGVSGTSGHDRWDVANVVLEEV